MAWSIFDQPASVQTNWVSLLLNALGAPQNQSDQNMVWDWMKSEGGGGVWNPLNQGPVPGQPQLTTSGIQYGGGAANFANEQAGIQGAVDYLHMPYYQAVLQDLMQGNGSGAAQALWQSPWAGSHYGYGSAWNTSPYPGNSGAGQPVVQGGPISAPQGTSEGMVTSNPIQGSAGGMLSPALTAAQTGLANNMVASTQAAGLQAKAAQEKAAGKQQTSLADILQGALVAGKTFG